MYRLDFYGLNLVALSSELEYGCWVIDVLPGLAQLWFGRPVLWFVLLVLQSCGPPVLWLGFHRTPKDFTEFHRSSSDYTGFLYRFQRISHDLIGFHKFKIN